MKILILTTLKKIVTLLLLTNIIMTSFVYASEYEKPPIRPNGVVDMQNIYHNTI